VFKIRGKRQKKTTKKREIGLASMLGSVCATSKERHELVNIAKELGLATKPDEIRYDICEGIKDKLLFLEKYSTTKKKNKMTYVIVPSNHPKYKFPYNLEDRKDHIINGIKEKIKFKIDLNVKENHSKIQGETVTTYEIQINNSTNLEDFSDVLRGYGFVLQGKKWIVIVD
jgi:hypothetical protein